MKYLSALIVTLIFTLSCCGLQQTTQDKAIETNTSEVVFAEPKKEDNFTKISLEEDGTISDDSITETTEIIYTEAFDHAIFNALLKKHVSENGNVNYKSIKSESKTFQRYIDLLKLHQPNDDWTKNDKLAYWINAYNALTIDLILRNYPTKSIKDIKDPWDQRLWKFGNTWQNLNDIEHEILRKMNEPRIHFAIVCASVSCPKLQNTAFTASNLDQQLTDATKEFLADTSKNELSKDNIKISKIFRWFKDDFEQNGSLIDFLNKYSDITISESTKKSYTDYNWNLND
ncbi:Uncharacterized protein DUF547 [Winogradskyella psychrotolerans RS-3]|uniref:Uncharacterized protein DUF547 n=1 Tax=Winogradskyella psychrotolerans RS-3 TaxID=641526 RepID=S7VWT5_9FLAO|nr:DUF547 domain-containing protein [Winogradskyella psychrotolerans]EPR73857.1 Uncharacterized protein DUF547 [Winogradskyella psychrotolerans RS-3]